MRLHPTDHRDHWVAAVPAPLPEAMGLDPRELGVTEVTLDEAGMPLIVERPPDRDGLGPEAPVRKADDERSAGPQHARDLAEHGHRLLQVLHRHTHHRGVDTPVA